MPERPTQYDVPTAQADATDADWEHMPTPVDPSLRETAEHVAVPGSAIIKKPTITSIPKAAILKRPKGYT